MIHYITGNSNIEIKVAHYSFKSIEDQNHYEQINMNYLKMHATSSSQESYLHIERIEIVVTIPGKELKQIYNISTKI
jgi:hypothetical protein